MPRGKDAGLAVIFTLLFPGLGHIYLERFLRAFVLVIALVVAFAIHPVLFLPVYLFVLYDAYSEA